MYDVYFIRVLSIDRSYHSMPSLLWMDEIIMNMKNRVLRVRAVDGSNTGDHRQLAEPADVLQASDGLPLQGHLCWSPFPADRHPGRQAQDPRPGRGGIRKRPKKSCSCFGWWWWWSGCDDNGTMTVATNVFCDAESHSTRCFSLSAILRVSFVVSVADRFVSYFFLFFCRFARTRWSERSPQHAPTRGGLRRRCAVTGTSSTVSTSARSASASSTTSSSPASMTT